MALFRRTPKNTVLPEVDKYYEGERRDRAGLAWLLALVSVVIVALVLTGAFLGGRWVYREIVSDDNEDVAVVNETTDDSLSFDGGADEEGEVGTGDEPAQTDTPSPTEPSSTPSTGSDDETPAVGGAQTDTPSTDSEALPSTGPSQTVATFVVVSTIAGVAHYIVSRKQGAN